MAESKNEGWAKFGVLLLAFILIAVSAPTVVESLMNFGTGLPKKGN